AGDGVRVVAARYDISPSSVSRAARRGLPVKPRWPTQFDHHCTTIPEKRLRHKLTTAKLRAEKRGLDFDDELYRRYVMNPPTNCACCNVRLDYEIITERGAARDTCGPSFDRIDSRLGYTIANVAVVCHRCNCAKS